MCVRSLHRNGLLSEIGRCQPPYLHNYFLKIINTWIRKGVKNTTDALNLINAPSSKTKPTKPVSSWYHKYMEDLEKKKEEEKDASESLAELESFFNGK